MDHNEALQSEACAKYLLGELSSALRDAYGHHVVVAWEAAASSIVGAGSGDQVTSPPVGNSPTELLSVLSVSRCPV